MSSSQVASSPRPATGTTAIDHLEPEMQPAASLERAVGTVAEANCAPAVVVSRIPSSTDLVAVYRSSSHSRPLTPDPARSHLQPPSAQDFSQRFEVESVLSQVDEESAAAGNAYAGVLLSEESSQPNAPSPSPAPRKPPPKAPKKPAPPKKDKGKENERSAAVAGKKRKAAEREPEDADDAEPTKRKRARKEKEPPSLFPRGSQFLVHSSSPAKVKYKSAKKRRPSPAPVDEVCDFDEIPGSDDFQAAPVKKTASKPKPKLQAKAKDLVPSAERDGDAVTVAKPRTRATRIAAAKAKHALVQEEHAPEQQNVKRKMKQKPKAKTDATLKIPEVDISQADELEAVVPRHAAKGKQAVRRVAASDEDEDRGDMSTNANAIAKPATVNETALAIPDVVHEPPTSKTAVAISPRPTAAAQELLHLSAQDDANLDADTNDDFNRFIDTSLFAAPAMSPPPVHSSPSASMPIATSTPVRVPEASAPRPAPRAKKPKKAPWELVEFDASKATSAKDAMAILAATGAPSAGKDDAVTPARAAVDGSTTVHRSSEAAPSPIPARAPTRAPIATQHSASPLAASLYNSHAAAPLVAPEPRSVSECNIPTTSAPASASVYISAPVDPFPTPSPAPIASARLSKLSPDLDALFNAPSSKPVQHAFVATRAPADQLMESSAKPFLSTASRVPLSPALQPHETSDSTLHPGRTSSSDKMWSLEEEAPLNGRGDQRETRVAQPEHVMRQEDVATNAPPVRGVTLY